MKYLNILLPHDLHHAYGSKKRISFHLTESNYYINEEAFPHNFDLSNIEFWDYFVLNRKILVMLFQKEDVLKF